MCCVVYEVENVYKLKVNEKEIKLTLVGLLLDK